MGRTATALGGEVGVQDVQGEARPRAVCTLYAQTATFVQSGEAVRAGLHEMGPVDAGAQTDINPVVVVVDFYNGRGRFGTAGAVEDGQNGRLDVGGPGVPRLDPRCADLLSLSDSRAGRFPLESSTTTRTSATASYAAET
jgi:hypothetical protein